MKTRCWPERFALHPAGLCALFVCLALLGAAPPAVSQQAQLPPAASSGVDSAVPENSGVRARLAELFYAPIAAGSRPAARVVADPVSGRPVRFEIRRQGTHLYYLFLNRQGSGFPIAGPGSYIVRRELESGRIDQIKVFLRNDPGSYLRLSSIGQRTSMDVYLFAVAVDRGVLLASPLERFLTEPFQRIVALSGSAVRWDLLLYRRVDAADRVSLLQAERIRRLLPSLGDRDDGALLGNGRYVFIENGLAQEGAGGLNCSGFAKWVVDGFYYPLTGRYLPVDVLKEKHLESRGNRWSARYEEERDPYFGLDWSRNLAAQLWKAAGLAGSDPERFDVRRSDYLRYREDIGYPVRRLELLLFLEAAENPGRFYIGSVNKEFGQDPVLRQHFHLLVLLPYFDPDGSFRVAVFDRNRESSLAEVEKRFADAYIHLVRLPLVDGFAPPLPCGPSATP